MYLLIVELIVNHYDSIIASEVRKSRLLLRASIFSIPYIPVDALMSYSAGKK